MARLGITSGEELNRELRKGKLPQMVDWFDPIVLGLVAVRTLISTTIGEYADQRPMQEVVDGDKGPLLTKRHDYSKLDIDGRFVIAPEGDPDNPRCDDRCNPAKPVFDPERPPRRLRLDEHGAMWVDFIADLGDGFEATYAMAYLLAASKLEVRGTARRDKLELPAGQMLIFGGDLAYPNATLEEYRARCVNPYNWAFTADRRKPEPERELFFVAGNHDWYDGLSAFTHQFCYESEAIGGWRCTQQRSYFAIKLPYDWWIWGVDVALGDGIDAGQVSYFQEIARDMKKESNPKIVIILHAPDWTKRAYRGLTRICEEARQRGEVCAILAGDLHHYSRYQSFQDKKSSPERQPPLQLIVSGGGGAFAHPTHDQPDRLEIDSAVSGRTLLDKGSLVVEVEQEPNYHFSAMRFYPSKMRSRALALKNLWLPLHNRRFALLVGFIYLFYAWIFNTSVPPEFAPGPSDSIFDIHVAGAAALAATARSNPIFFFMLLGLWVALVFYADARLEHRLWKWLNGPIKVAIGTLHFALHITALLFVSAVTTFLALKLVNPIVGAGILYLKLAVADIWSSASGANLSAMYECASKFDWSGRDATTWQCVQQQLGHDAFYISVTALTQAAISVLVGGAMGAFIFGCYWVITSVLFNMHQDAFSALAIKDYKNFLRMKFEKDKLTIYPIALDRVPGPRDWRAWDPKRHPEDAKLDHMPLLVPERTMKPRLIEDPIEIIRGDIPAFAKMRSRGSGAG
jgi:hypothetical protein